MLFNSVAYAVFLPIVFFLYWAVPHKYRWILLLGASYYFYMSWNVRYVFLILFTTVVSYAAGILLEKTESVRVKKAIVAAAAVLCLGVLFVFKYFNFVSESVTNVLNMFTLNVHSVTLNLILPVGISFYTFQTVSYIVDVYKGESKAELHFGYYAVFVSFFPQLVAGPIERTGNLLPQLKEKRIFDYDQSVYGLRLMAWGFFKKLLIADVLAIYVDKAYASIDTCTGFDLLAAVFFFTIQIYCDFSGYSDIAIGSAKLMGINLMRNFDSPYFAASVKEFWSRWHISLSTWFRDYVYIPLGGNRCSKAKRDRNLMVTFLTSGLWHGADWTYVVWGGLHGLAQVIENRLHIRRDSMVMRFVSWIVVFVFCNIAWVFFRAETVSDACEVISNLISAVGHPGTFFHSTIGLSLNGEANGRKILPQIAVSLAVLAAYDYASLKTDVLEWFGRRRTVVRWIVYIAYVYLMMVKLAAADKTTFIYFQF